MSEARRLLERVLEHCEELREAWERGALDEHDGKGGTRSSRNYARVIELERFLAQPMTKCEDLAAAICFLEHSKNTHENWAAWLADGKVASPDAGDLEHHRRCILEYEHILDVIQGSAREGELVAALKAAWPFLWHLRSCISVVGVVESGHPCDCGFTEMIELVKEVRGQACP